MTPPLGLGGSEYWIQWLSNSRIITPLTIFNNVIPLPCSHPTCSDLCVHLAFLPEIVCKVGKIYKVKKCVQLFTLFTIISTFAERKKTGYLPFMIHQLSSLHFAFLKSNILSRIIFSSLVPSDKPYSLA